MDEIRMEDIRRIVGLQLGARSVRETDRFLEDLAAESADVVNIVAVVEERYGIIITESELARLFTPSDLYELARKKLEDGRA